MLKQAGPLQPGASGEQQQQEVAWLRAELEKTSVQHEEELCRREIQHSAELKNHRKELNDAETQQLMLQKEILMLKDKLEKTRREKYVPVWTHWIMLIILCVSIIPLMDLATG